MKRESKSNVELAKLLFSTAICHSMDTHGTSLELPMDNVKENITPKLP